MLKAAFQMSRLNHLKMVLQPTKMVPLRTYTKSNNGQNGGGYMKSDDYESEGLNNFRSGYQSSGQGGGYQSGGGGGGGY